MVQQQWAVGQQIGFCDGAGMSAGLATIVKVGKRDVVLNDGQRFSADRGTVSTRGAYGPTRFFTAPDDPKFLAARTKIDRERAAYEVGRLGTQFSRSPSKERANALIDATNRWLALTA